MRSSFFVAAVLALVPLGARADDPVCTIPAGTHVTFNVNAPISSSKSRTGEVFGFTLARSIETPDCTIEADGANGIGLVFLAGASGSNGHEGDLTIRPDEIRTADGRLLTFEDQRIGINGKNRKIESTVLGFVPWVGMAAGYIRGSDIHVDENTPIDTVLLHPAIVTTIQTAPPPEMPRPQAGPEPE